MFEEFQKLFVIPDGRVSAVISNEEFLVIRYFLTVRNDSIDDNKRLSFDKAILELRTRANDAIAQAARPARGVAGFLGLGGG